MKIKKIILFVYFILLFVLVGVKFNGSFYELYNRANFIRDERLQGIWNVNLVPFVNIKYQISCITEWWAVKNLLGNTIAFIPLGFLLPILKKCNNFLKVFLVSLIIITSIELFQLITMLGYFDVDDIILKMVGSIVGYCCYLSFHKFIKG